MEGLDLKRFTPSGGDLLAARAGTYEKKSPWEGGGERLAQKGEGRGGPNFLSITFKTCILRGMSVGFL